MTNSVRRQAVATDTNEARQQTVIVPRKGHDHQLGGYQVWTGYHSYAEPGTGERIVEEAVAMLNELAKPE